MVVFNNVESILKELGLSNIIVLCVILIISLIIFSLKNYDKSEYEILLLSNFNKLKITFSKYIPMYVLIFFVSILTIRPETFDMRFETLFLFYAAVIVIFLFIHIVLIHVVSFTDLKNDYYLKIEESGDRYKIIKLINNDIMLLENENTKLHVYSTVWKDKNIVKEVRNSKLLNEIYIGRDLKKGLILSGVILIFSVVLIGVAILFFLNKINSYTIIFGTVGVIGILNIINLWLNCFTFWFISKTDEN